MDNRKGHKNIIQAGVVRRTNGSLPLNEKGSDVLRQISGLALQLKDTSTSDTRNVETVAENTLEDKEFTERFDQVWADSAVQDYLLARGKIHGKVSTDKETARVQMACFDLILATGADISTLDRLMDRVYDITNNEECDLYEFTSKFYQTVETGVKNPRTRKIVESIARARVPWVLKKN